MTEPKVVHPATQNRIDFRNHNLDGPTDMLSEDFPELFIPVRKPLLYFCAMGNGGLDVHCVRKEQWKLRVAHPELFVAHERKHPRMRHDKGKGETLFSCWTLRQTRLWPRAGMIEKRTTGMLSRLPFERFYG